MFDEFDDTEVQIHDDDDEESSSDEDAPCRQMGIGKVSYFVPIWALVGVISGIMEGAPHHG